MTTSEGKLRCAKWFIMITRNCKKWLLHFVKGRLPKNLQLIEFIDNKNLRYKDSLIDINYEKFTENESVPLQGLLKIIWHGEILKTNEEKRNGSFTAPTIGYQIDRIRLFSNDLMHIRNGTLDEQEYNDRVDDLKEIARFFEAINDRPEQYVKQIDDVCKKGMDKTELDKIIEGYERYIKWEVEHNMTSFTEKKKESFAKQFAGEAADHFDSPFGQAVGGVVGGAVGLSKDLFDFLKTHLK